MSGDPYLTKSAYVSAHICERWLWNNSHDPVPYEKPAPGSSADIGNKVGRLAHDLFPGGVLVSGFFKKHAEALGETRRLMADRHVPAIFEAAFEHEGVRVRVDVLERLGGGAWGIREVKSASSVRKTKKKFAPLKEKYALDIAVQVAVARGAGVDIGSARFVHVNKEYVLESDTPDPDHFFRQVEVLDDIEDAIEDVPMKTGPFLRVLRADTAPAIEPARSMCSKIGGAMCPYWARCTADKPGDWVDALYFPVRGQLAELKEGGAVHLSDLDEDQLRKPEQARMARVASTGAPLIEPDLAAALAPFAPPAIHLDFEYLAGVAWPLHIGTRAHQRVPFQFSAHRLNADMSFEHIAEFLGPGTEDPSRAFAEHLIALLKGGTEPIVAYSARSAELPVLDDLAIRFPDLADDLNAVADRIVDIKTLVQSHIMVPALIENAARSGGSLYTLKSVAPALAGTLGESFTYDDLGAVSNGLAAVEAWVQMVTGELPAGMSDATLRASMLAYCHRDTEATVVVQRALAALAALAH